MQPAAKDALIVERLTAGYPGRPVINNLDFGPLAPGHVTALVGPNAAGKSTLLMALAGLLKSTGAIRLGNYDLLAMSAAERASLIAFMPQALPQGVSLTVIESVMAALKATHRPRASAARDDTPAHALAALESLSIAHLALEYLDRLSGGQRQLVSLAQAIASEPRVLLLDEPTSALDLHYQVSVMRLVRRLAREGRIVVIVVHDLNLAARWADRIAILHRGTVIAHGAPSSVLTIEMLARVYGVSAYVEKTSLGHVHVLVDDVIQRST
jgi:iron complex transport system ATP-binding protein